MGTLSELLWQRSASVLAGGPATLSKHPRRGPFGIGPLFLRRGDGAYVWDIEGRQYIDCVAALGPVLLGHNHPLVLDRVITQVMHGLASSSLSTGLEVEVAERLVAMIPGAEQVRFATNGADVTNAAIKVARYVTGKPHVIFCGYHGQHDSYLSTTEKRGGILPQIAPYNHQVPWGDRAALEAALDVCWGLCVPVVRDDGTIGRQRRRGLAAIMVEVPPRPLAETPAETAAMLAWYREQAHAAGALFLLDEVVTGFRYAPGGAQALYGVVADLACFSKGMANGYPCAALSGPRDLMQAFDGGQVFLSTTFGAQVIGMAACAATLQALQDDHRTLVDMGGMALDALRVLLAERPHIPMRLRGNYARFVLDFGDAPGRATAAELRTLWLQELAYRGVLASVPYFPMCCYTLDVVDALRTAWLGALAVLGDFIDGGIAIGDALKCPVIEDVFGQRYAAAGERSARHA